MLLIHISDLHFRKGEAGTHLDANRHIRNELLRDAEDMCRKLGSPPDGVLITGDLTYAGDPEEYGFALEWLELFCTRCGATTDKIFLVPGNHDVVRDVAFQPVTRALHNDIYSASTLSVDGVITGLLNDPEAGRLLYASLANYNNFAGQYFCGLIPPKRTMAKRNLKLNDGSILCLLGLNSTFASSASDTKERGLFVDPAANQIIRERGVVNATLCHHPYDWLRGGEVLHDHLNDVAPIQLFGHKHTNRIELGKYNVRIAASAAHPDREEHGWEPGYNLIELEVLGDGATRQLDVKVHVRIWQKRPGEFVAKQIRGDSVFHQLIGLDSWAAPDPEASDEAMGQEDTLRPTTEDPMDSVRDISVRFFKLSLSQKSAIAGKLDLLENDDISQPDFERFRRVFVRAKDRGLVEELNEEIVKLRAE